MLISKIKSPSYSSLIQSVPLNCGGSITFDSQTNKVTDFGYGLQMDKGDVCLSSLATRNEFMAQIYMRISDLWEVGFETGWNQDTKLPKVGGVSQLKLESGSLIKAKIESSGKLFLGYTFSMEGEGVPDKNFGVSISYSAYKI